MKNTKFSRDKIWLILGLLAAAFFCLPYLINGEGAIISYHDQLDGELITYLLGSKYLFQKVSSYPELMGGIPKNGLVSPAPLYVLFYRLLPPYGAFLFSLLLNKIISFLFMYLLVKKLTKRSGIAFLTGIWFLCIPFYAVYGLCIPGQPMLWYAVLLLAEGRPEGKGKTWMLGPLGLVILYGASSSLALCGFAILAVLFAVLLILILQKKPGQAAGVGIALTALGITYALGNLSLIGQLLLGNAGFVTHKSEMKAFAASFPETFIRILFTGEDYCNAYQIVALPTLVAALILIISQRGRKKTDVKTGGEDLSVKGMFIALGLLCGIAFWRALYQSEAFVAFRNRSSGVVHDFNFGRFTWLTPVLWCLVFAFSADLLVRFARERKKPVYGKIAEAVMVLTAAAACCIAVYQGDLKPNLVKILRHGDYYMMTWEQFFAEDLFEQVDEVIGRPKEDYRIVSLGIYPAAAAYNGFYCLDAYSNNYDLEYKHQFRKIIAPQLEKSAYLSSWFDEWGNRCYMLLAEFGNYFTCEKKWGPYTQEYEFDLGQLKAMGGEYLISAVYLVGSEENGLELLNPEPIQTDDSWYRLWVYRVE